MAMRTKKPMIFVAAIAATFLMPGLANAHDGTCVYSPTQDDIATHINDLKTYISKSDGFVTNKKFSVSRDQVGLEAKAVAALSKALEEKYGDSIAKLEDMMAKVNALLDAPKTKLDETAGDDILYLTELAYNCVLDVQMERIEQL
jgi:hypothetical protein